MEKALLLLLRLHGELTLLIVLLLAEQEQEQRGAAQDDNDNEDDEREEARLAPVPPATKRKPVRCLHKDRNMVVLVFDREWQHVLYRFDRPSTSFLRFSISFRARRA